MTEIHDDEDADLHHLVSDKTYEAIEALIDAKIKDATDAINNHIVTLAETIRKIMDRGD